MSYKRAVQKFEFACRRGTVLAYGQKMRLDQYLAEEFNEIPKTVVKELISKGCVSIDEEPILIPHFKVHFDDTIRMEIDQEMKDLIDFSVIDFDDPEEIQDSIFPEDHPLEILHEDDDLLIINKPAGMVTHPAPNTRRHFSGSLVNILLHRYEWFKDLTHKDAHFQPGIVHRLDAGTSGCLAIAKNNKSWENLRGQFNEHIPERIYVGFVHRILKPQTGLIDLSLARLENAPNKTGVAHEQGDGISARTHYKVLFEFPHNQYPFSLVSFKLDTGRNHQIRVHMKSKLCPILNDKIYGREVRSRNIKKLQEHFQESVTLPDNQMFLHAASLQLFHPANGSLIKVTAPFPPQYQEMMSFLKTRTLAWRKSEVVRRLQKLKESEIVYKKTSPY